MSQIDPEFFYLYTRYRTQSESDFIRTVKVYHAQGKDINVTNHYGFTVLDIAIDENKPELAKALKSVGCVAKVKKF